MINIKERGDAFCYNSWKSVNILFYEEGVTYVNFRCKSIFAITNSQTGDMGLIMFRVTRSNRRSEGQFWTQEWTRERVRSGAGYVNVVGVLCNRGMASAAVCGKPQAGWTRRIWNNHLQPEYITRAIYFGLFRFCFHDLVELEAWRWSQRSVDRKSAQR